MRKFKIFSIAALLTFGVSASPSYAVGDCGVNISVQAYAACMAANIDYSGSGTGGSGPRMTMQRFDFLP